MLILLLNFEEDSPPAESSTTSVCFGIKYESSCSSSSSAVQSSDRVYQSQLGSTWGEGQSGVLPGVMQTQGHTRVDIEDNTSPQPESQVACRFDHTGDQVLLAVRKREQTNRWQSRAATGVSSGPRRPLRRRKARDKRRQLLLVINRFKALLNRCDAT